MIPDNLKYTKEHEWLKVDGDVATVGVTDYAQEQLTDVVFVELPELNKIVEPSESIAAIESVKSVSDILAPLSGEIIEINEDLIDNPQLINEDAYGKGWMFKIKLSKPEEQENLLNHSDYKNVIGDK